MPALLISVIAPVFGVVLASWVLARVVALPARLTAGFQRLTFDALVPALLFHTMATVPLHAQFDANVLVAYYLPTLSVYALVFAAMCAAGRSPRHANILALAGSYSNAVLLGIPLILRAYGDNASAPLFAIVGLHSAAMFFLTTLIHELASANVRMASLVRDTALRLVRNPILMALLAGAAVNAWAIALPPMLFRLTDICRTVAPYAALLSMGIAMGAGIAAYDLRGARADAITVVLCKLVLHPLLVWLCCMWLLGPQRLHGQPGLTEQVLITLAALPCGINAYLFAVRFGAAEAASARAILLSTALSIVSLAGVLYWLSP